MARGSGERAHRPTSPFALRRLAALLGSPQDNGDKQLPVVCSFIACLSVRGLLAIFPPSFIVQEFLPRRSNGPQPRRAHSYLGCVRSPFSREAQAAGNPSVDRRSTNSKQPDEHPHRRRADLCASGRSLPWFWLLSD
ncbi:hypothetical protein BS78_08G094300 [Paspalum vaginatum]|nr:hypothetical protein BS78_08G094300 [Paspalum vaginatum]